MYKYRFKATYKRPRKNPIILRCCALKNRFNVHIYVKYITKHQILSINYVKLVKIPTAYAIGIFGSVVQKKPD